MSGVYLCGAITGLSRLDAMAWREQAKVWLESHAAQVKMPVPLPHSTPAEIVAKDLALVQESNVLFCNARWPSWGSAMEVYHMAAVLKRPVVTFAPQGRYNTSEFLRHYSVIMEEDWYAALKAACMISLGRLYKEPKGA